MHICLQIPNRVRNDGVWFGVRIPNLVWDGGCFACGKGYLIKSLRPIGRVAEGKTAARRAGAIAQPWKAGINCIPAIYTREFSSKTHPCNRKDMTRPPWRCFIGIGINCRDLTGHGVPGTVLPGMPSVSEEGIRL
jgi:hypothetical protein